MKQMLKIATFASGGGSNFQAIVDAIEHGEIPARMVVCISNRPDAGVLERAKKHEIPTIVISPDEFETEDEYCAALLDHLNRLNVGLIVLAGYMRKIPVAIVRAFRNKMLNIHPALLPAFGGKGMYGRRVHQAVLDYGVRWTGATVHIVDEEYDHGPVVLQEPVRVKQDDTPESLAARVLETEHKLYPEAVRLFASNRIRIEGRKVYILDPVVSPERSEFRSFEK